MTCVVGIVKNERVWIGADSQGTRGDTIIIRSDEKVFRTAEYIFGIAGSFRGGNLLRYAFMPPEPPDDPDDLYRFMVTHFVDTLRDCFKNGGFNNEEDESCVQFLVGIKGYLFHVDPDYQVGQTTSGYMAIGGGADFALGALHVTKTKAPRQRILEALEASAEYCIGVRGPFNVLELK